MPTNSTDIPRLLTYGLRTLFFNEFNTPADTSWQDIVTEIPSNGAKESYGWLGSTPAMREWVSERMPKALKDNGFSITNKRFEASMSVTQEAIDDDQYGQIMIRVRQLAEAAKNYYPERAYAVFTAGNTSAYGTCYDGKNFFANNHSEGKSGTQNNLLSATLSSASLTAARTAMMRFKDENGKAMGISGNTLIVPPELETTALELVGGDLITRYVSSTVDAVPTVNVHKGKYNVIVTPAITDVDSWYLSATNRITKPLIFQNRKATKFDSLEGSSDTNFSRGEYQYGVSNRFEFGYADWRTAIANIP